MSSAPISSGVSARTDVPPAATSRSLATPSAGLAVMPESASEPPHSSPTTSSAGAIGARSSRAARSTARAARAVPASIVARDAAAAHERDELDPLPERGGRLGEPRVVLGDADEERLGDVGVGHEAGEAAPHAPAVVALAARRLVADGDRARHGRRDPLGGQVRGGADGHDQHVVADAPAAAGARISGQRGAHIVLANRRR